MHRTKVLFAYDGSPCANDALDELKRAGLPPELELLVVSVAEVWVAETDDMEGAVPDAERIAAQKRFMSERARAGLESARGIAEQAAARIRESFPGWTVGTRVYPDSPAWGVLHAAQEWSPDLIILGSQGRSAFGRFFIGSVSQKVLSEALCSVRVARRRDHIAGSPMRLLVGVDGTPDSDAAVDAIASRVWPPGSSVKVFSVIGLIGVFNEPGLALGAMQWPEDQEGDSDQWKRMEKTTGDAVAKLRGAGLLADATVCNGAPVPMILQEAEQLGADCIFLGARGHRFMERFLLGSVSSAVANRAGCSVEIVRTTNVAGTVAGDNAER